jgi:hypothetical protein
LHLELEVPDTIDLTGPVDIAVEGGGAAGAHDDGLTGNAGAFGVSLDGVTQGLGGSDQDGDDGFASSSPRTT